MKMETQETSEKVQGRILTGSNPIHRKSDLHGPVFRPFRTSTTGSLGKIEGDVLSVDLKVRVILSCIVPFSITELVFNPTATLSY